MEIADTALPFLIPEKCFPTFQIQKKSIYLAAQYRTTIK